MSVLYIHTLMKFIVSYDSYACDDGVAERVDTWFDDFFDACDYYVNVNETEDNCVIQVKLDDVQQPAELPF